MIPIELEQEFKKLDGKLDRMAKSGVALRRSITNLRTLVVEHYADVHKVLRMHERELTRIKERLHITEPLPPDPDVPRPLPDPP